ncbi:hypothetical protein QWJ34_09955 [Saccharibacillus sp. CPCC 101409]|uniref:hypothetical protein n=1 Tax=Saccharibacillus sp. CPCC 101409 TaxID=3058041 RepID=UPI002672E67E|nr:hypothetical protein [Saccharibacillus sp. CPCC 101409]MDO3410084.1 hypothetical protein [Saccharibacillus sp. CPCC 101409]
MNGQPWSKTTLLGLSLAVAFTGFGLAGTGPAATQSVSAAAASGQSNAYDRFNDYVSRAPSPSSLSLARAVLVNHAKTFTGHQATLAVLKLENAQNAYLNKMTDRLWEEKVQDKIISVYEPGMTLNQVLGKVSGTEAAVVLQDMQAIHYKLETTEGIFYPIIDYKDYRQFKTRVKDDIAAYIDLQSAESEQPSAADAGLIISWDEAAKRALDREAFIARHKTSNRIEDVKRLFEGSKMMVFYGLDNTPLFEYTTKKVDPQAKAAYKKLLDGKSDAEIKASGVLTHMKGLLDLLEKTGDKQTAQVENYVKKNVPLNF